MNPIGIYIHIPFCKRKCSYCDFVSYAGAEEMMERYVDAVIQEARTFAPLLCDTLFLGGGTPSLLPTGLMTRLMKGLLGSIRFAPNAEISIEINPGTLCPDKAREYACLGINRASLGLQTIQPELLRVLGRIHSAADFENSISLLRNAGISNLSADLMYSLPGQTVAEVRDSARFALDLGLSHLSAYALKLEKGVPLYGCTQPDEDTDRAMFAAIAEEAARAGMERYEISNFSLPGKQCRHNLKYWNLDDYLGLGRGCSFLPRQGALRKSAQSDRVSLRYRKERLCPHRLRPGRGAF